MTNKKRFPLIVAGFVLLVGSSAFATPYALNAPTEPNIAKEPAGRVRHRRPAAFGLATPDVMLARPVIASPSRSRADVQLSSTSIPVL